MPRSVLLPLIILAACTTVRKQDPAPAVGGQAGSVASAGTQGAPASQASGDMEFMNATRMLSGAVRVGKTLYLSGQLGSDSTGAYGGITAETRNALEKVKALVERHGSSMDRVAKCTVYLADMSEWSAMNAVYTTYFPNNRPARSAIGTSLLSGARVEIECIAILP